MNAGSLTAISDLWSRLSLLGRIAAVAALALLAANLGMWRLSAEREAQMAAEERQLSQLQEVFDQVKAADARDQKRRDAEQDLANRRQSALAPLLALENINPTTLVIDAARELDVPLTSVRTDRRNVVSVLNQRLEQTDVHVEVRGPLNKMVWLIEQLEQTSRQNLFLRGLALTRVPEGWRSVFTYRVFRSAPNS